MRWCQRASGSAAAGTMSVAVCGFFFQAEDGIRDVAVTGVQTCALPIFPAIRAWLDHGRVMLARPTSKSSAGQNSHFYRCPGCDEMVDGRALTEVLTHPQQDRKSVV